VSALAHWLEEEGLATAMVSLVKPQSDAVGPPRALWVPFELGRPLGEPEDPAFQRRVLMRLLDMLVADGGPRLSLDFADDAPGAQPLAAWSVPLRLPPKLGLTGDVDATRTAVEAELAAVMPGYARGMERQGRTTVGVGALPLDQIPGYLASFLRPELPTSASADLPAMSALRFALDDLRACYFEAALSDGARPSSVQLADWFWDHTLVGEIIRSVRRRYLEHEDPLTRAVADGALIPRSRA
jgi:hypothetical protein